MYFETFYFREGVKARYRWIYGRKAQEPAGKSLLFIVGCLQVIEVRTYYTVVLHASKVHEEHIPDDASQSFIM